MIKITCIVENTVFKKSLKAEHGLSFFIETDNGNLIFDFGQSSLFLQNAGILGKPFLSPDYMVLSHGHYDHTGGLVENIELFRGKKIIAHPGVFSKRYTPSETGGARSVGIPAEKEQFDKNFVLNLSKEPREIFPGLIFAGEIPRINSFENTGGDFFTDSEMTEKDLIPDDSCLIIDTAAGTVLIFGCSHSGIINTLDYVSEKWNTKKFALIAGGLHLLNSSAERMEKTITRLKEFEIGFICPGHCTGWKSFCKMYEAFPDKVSPLFTGWTWTG